jgi:hypothetical protein
MMDAQTLDAHLLRAMVPLLDVEVLMVDEHKTRCSIQGTRHMTLVEECGATPRTNEHFIGTILFTKRAER